MHHLNSELQQGQGLLIVLHSDDLCQRIMKGGAQ